MINKPDLEKLTQALDEDETLTDAEKREIYNDALSELEEFQKYESEEYEEGMRRAEEELMEPHEEEE